MNLSPAFTGRPDPEGEQGHGCRRPDHSDRDLVGWVNKLLDSVCVRGIACSSSPCHHSATMILRERRITILDPDRHDQERGTCFAAKRLHPQITTS